MKTLHPKIEALRKSIGSVPILRAHLSTKLVQPDSIRAANSNKDNGRLLKQYFAIWGIPDDYGTVPIKGCFAKSIQERGPKSNASYKITALWQHMQSEPLAIPSILKEDDIGLYAEVSPDEGIPTCDRCVIQVRSGTVNNGSYGFNYVWDKMEYDEANDVILMKECELFEISFVTIGSQKETFGVRGANGEYIDEFLVDETEDLIKRIPRQFHLELRNIIDRHITLAKNQPLETRQKALDEGKPQQEGLYDFLLKNLKTT